MSKRIDLTNKKFGKLLVKQMIYGEFCNGKKRTKCLCLCDCGRECIAVADKLKSGRKTSCGCDSKQRVIEKNRRDLTGQRFNRLVVKEMLWQYKPTRAACECDCGNEIIVIGTGLTSGKTGSCGCLQRDITSSVNTKDWRGTITKYGIEFLKPIYKNKKNLWMWECRCGMCGDNFIALPAKIISGHTTSCGCKTRSSKEQFIKNLLDEYNINYIEQYRFFDCKDKHTLPFDFAIMKDGEPELLIEYDGVQHYKPVEIFGGEAGYQETIHRDIIKTNYCKSNNYKLLRLPYNLTDEEIERKILNIIYP